MPSRYFGTQNPVKPHLLQATGGIAAEVTDLRGDIEAAFALQQAEAAKATASLPATPYTGQVCWDTTASVLKVWNGASWASTAAAASTLASDLASTASGKGASLIGIIDADGYYAATTVEAALAEVRVLANAAAPASDLSSVATGRGASLIGIEDAGTLYAATTVEAALAEVIGVANGKWPTPVAQAITGALSTVTDAAAQAVLTSIINALVTLGLATNTTT